MTEAGIDEILIVTGTDHMGDVVSLLGSGKDFGCKFTYKVQDEAGGIAQALGLAENFVGDDSMLVILGDNIFSASLANELLSTDFKVMCPANFDFLNFSTIYANPFDLESTYLTSI